MVAQLKNLFFLINHTFGVSNSTKRHLALELYPIDSNAYTCHISSTNGLIKMASFSAHKMHTRESVPFDKKG